MENGDYVVAIDLGTNTVATVVGTRGEGGKVRIIDCEISPVQGVVRSEIKNVELVAQSIKRTIEAIEARQQITIREAYAGISGQHIRCVKSSLLRFCRPRRRDPRGGRPEASREHGQCAGSRRRDHHPDHSAELYRRRRGDDEPRRARSATSSRRCSTSCSATTIADQPVWKRALQTGRNPAGRAFPQRRSLRPRLCCHRGREGGGCGRGRYRRRVRPT